MSVENEAGAWIAQSPVTDPRAAASAVAELPRELSALREASSRLVFHYRAGGDFAENGVPAERAAEIHTRYAGAMLGLLLERGERSLARDRAPADRVVGCCRDATVLFVALARQQGFAARARVGFASYLTPGWMVDHVIAEVWDEAAGRWRLIEPEMSAGWTPSVNGRPVDWLDVADDQFVTGPRAWQAVRAGADDPARYVVAPELDVPVLRGLTYVAHNVIHDLAALNKTEMLLWDGWGVQLEQGPGPVPEEAAALIDEISAATADPGVSPAVVAALAGRDGLRVPATVTRFDPYGGPPCEIALGDRTAG